MKSVSETFLVIIIFCNLNNRLKSWTYSKLRSSSLFMSFQSYFKIFYFCEVIVDFIVRSSSSFCYKDLSRILFHLWCDLRQCSKHPIHVSAIRCCYYNISDHHLQYFHLRMYSSFQNARFSTTFNTLQSVRIVRAIILLSDESCTLSRGKLISMTTCI